MKKTDKAKKQNMGNRRDMDNRVNRLQKVAELSMQLTGEPLQVFERIAHMIGELLNVSVVCLSEIRGEELFFLSVYVNGEVMTNAGSCPLHITPCATVLQSKDMRIYDYVADKFPEATFLKMHNAFSYCGFPSLDRSGNVAAVTCLIDDKPHDFTDEDKDLLQIFGQRIAMEIEREKNLAERKKMEMELKKLYIAVEQSPNCIVITDIKGNITYINPKFTDLTGYTFEETIGQNPRFLKSGKQTPEFYKQLWDTIMSGKEWRGEFQNKKKNGELYWENASISPIINEDGMITDFIAIKEDFTEHKKAEETISKMAYFDQLTDLPNRVLLSDRLNHMLAKGQRYKEIAAILFLDIDNFKHINDTVGHDEGDNMLKDVAKRLSKHVRACDTLARHGGDEFIILIQDLKKAENVISIVERIFSEFNEPFILNGQEFFITTSIGISIYPDDGEDKDTLLKNADIAMYRAKEDGKNTYQLFTPVMNERTIEIIKVKGMLHKAIKNEEFILHYQPQVNIITGDITAIEALVRWQNPERGLVYPDAFIPLAEETGQIVSIGEWVLYTACAQNKVWQDKCFKPIKMAVNVSIRQFKKNDFVSTVKRILKNTGLAPEYLEFEVTESIVMENIESSLDILHELKSMGIKLTIDDFGTGYSSFEYLKHMPIDMLKIGMPFVQNITVNPDDAAIAKAIIEVAHIMNLEVIAEGVETIEQLKLLRTLHCDKIQGFLVSKPLPSSKGLEEFLEKEGRRSKYLY